MDYIIQNTKFYILDCIVCNVKIKDILNCTSPNIKQKIHYGLFDTIW